MVGKRIKQMSCGVGLFKKYLGGKDMNRLDMIVLMLVQERSV